MPCGEQSSQSSRQQRLAAGERLHQAERRVEVDEERLVAPGQGAVQEGLGDRVRLTPDRLHAAGRVDRQTQRQGDVVRDVEILDLAPLPVLADLEVFGLELSDRVAAPIDDQYLELDELNVDLGLELGALEQFDVFQFPAVSQACHDPDEVLGRDARGRDVGRHRAHAAGPGLALEVVEGSDQPVRAVELDPLQGFGARHGDAGLDPDRRLRRRSRSQRFRRCAPRTEGSRRFSTISSDPAKAPRALVALASMVCSRGGSPSLIRASNGGVVTRATGSPSSRNSTTAICGSIVRVWIMTRPVSSSR